jgi:molecular chaperone GrpE (heat shock protein)/DNA-binding Xre family transcriptional regulator
MGDSPTESVDYSPRLQALMQRVGIPSYRALSKESGVSRTTITTLRQGRLARLRVDTLLKLSNSLEVSLPVLIQQFTPDLAGPGDAIGASPPPPAASAPQESAQIKALQQEYERLQRRMERQQVEVRQAVQQDAIALIEPWLLQWPTAVNAVQQNDTLPASRLLPLVKPLEKLLQSWDITPIGAVGEEVTYDPQLHQPMSGAPQPGDRVKIRYVGYRQGDKLLHRAKVSPANPQGLAQP